MQSPEHDHHHLTSRCLRYVLLLRVVAISGLVAAFFLLQETLDVTLPLLPFLLPVLLVTVLTVYSWHRLQRGGEVSERRLLFQLLVDIAAISWLLYHMGGSTNPMVSLFLLPVTVAAATLQPRHIRSVVITAIICYTVLMFVHNQLPQQHHHMHDFNVHVWGMWSGFLLSAILVAYFVTRIGQTLRASDLALARAREEALQAEQMIALGSLAAGTAHELGTPLSTMAVLTRELELESASNPELNDQIVLLSSQIERCKSILSVMSHHAGTPRADGGHHQVLDKFLGQLLDEWQSGYPDVRLERQFDGEQPPVIYADKTLAQAFINLLNNAVDAKAEKVTLIASWNSQRLGLEMIDDGLGIDEKILPELGQPFVSTKRPGKGLGLGVFLARSTFERLGGSLQLLPAETRGTRVIIDLPLDRILRE